ncbi:P1 family peptidase [Hoyosella altamirensis]|uniref:L-aminopeptidase/D-esterase-like protein n=1 Tax=Hoyosella altamirensis TaxID=616997 RepID=A0A839RHE3_9ACTN|nr:P1 family peptidase [Hoyosella altamirensis]MBB3035807.1 L-aminopeptidase/D-esterase-like protein [Hoyosella altamirensis]
MAAAAGTDRRTGARNALTDVPGLLVGHWSRLDSDASLGSGWATGCTVVLAPEGAVASADVRGGGPGTRETDLLRPENTVQHVHGVLLSGGSAYGLAAAGGVMRWLEERGHGLAIGGEGLVVPIVAGAVIFDLPVGAWGNRPDAESGYSAADAASRHFATGSAGAGTAARAGAIKGGVGTASVVLGAGPAAGATIGALLVVNPVGSVYSPKTGLPWGAESEIGDEFDLPQPSEEQIAAAAALAAKGTVVNTTIGVVATDVPLDKAGCKRLSIAGQTGLTRAIRPAHSPLDGDTIFALSTGKGRAAAPELDSSVTPAPPDGIPAETGVLDALCAAAADCVERAIVHAVLDAAPVAGIPGYRDLFHAK